jgi:substrate import-associated zinc metallohydrolase lipoprotein
MKKIYLFLLMIVAINFSACKEEKLGDSIFDTSAPERDAFDRWLVENYVYPYNIELKYRMEDIESEIDYELSPADLDKSKMLAVIVKYLWLESYDEVAGIEFTRKYVPKIIHLVGSPAYNINGSIVLGTAEGGLKVTLYMVNELVLNADLLNRYYFRTMHHEFAHILHQTKHYDPDFKRISDGYYIGDNWVNQSDAAALREGFITPYGQSAVDEDFVEIIANFVTHNQAWWDAQLTTAGANGSSILNKKLELIKDYLQNSWNIDLYELRDVVQRRTGEISQLDFDKF